MTKHRILLITLFMHTMLYAQFIPLSLPGVRILESGIVLGTERERYFSMRLDALGRNFGGYIDDFLTDVYRNPAYFARTEGTTLFGDFVRSQYQYDVIRVAPYTYYYYPIVPVELNTDGYETSSIQPVPYQFQSKSLRPIGINLGFVEQFGVLVRGNYARSSSQRNESFSGLDYGNRFIQNDLL